MACAALCRKEQSGPRAAVAKLLHDPRPMVRLRIALALADQHDIEAVPVLIDLLAELPPAGRAPIEAFLQQLAGEWAPTLNLPDDDVSRKTRRDAWAAWRRNTEGSALLAEFRKRTLTPVEQDKLLALIHNLGDDTFVVRERQRRPRAHGPRLCPCSAEATHGTDLETRWTGIRRPPRWNRPARTCIPYGGCSKTNGRRGPR